MFLNKKFCILSRFYYLNLFKLIFAKHDFILYLFVFNIYKNLFMFRVYVNQFNLSVVSLKSSILSGVFKNNSNFFLYNLIILFTSDFVSLCNFISFYINKFTNLGFFYFSYKKFFLPITELSLLLSFNDNKNLLNKFLYIFSLVQQFLIVRLVNVCLRNFI